MDALNKAKSSIATNILDIGSKLIDKLKELEELNNTDVYDIFKGMNYEEIIQYRYENAVNKTCQQMYEKYREDIEIVDNKYKGTTHYNPADEGIYLLEAEDKENIKGYA